MKQALLLPVFCLVSSICFSQSNNGPYIIPDSIQAIAFYAEIDPKYGAVKKQDLGIRVNDFVIKLSKDKDDKKIIYLDFDKQGKEKVIAPGVTGKKGSYYWNYEWKEMRSQPFMIAVAVDSATHSSIYSGYLLIPEEQKWKLIATQVFPDTQRIKKAMPAWSGDHGYAVFSNRWLLRSNGSWKALDSQTTKPPVFRPVMRNIDSLAQQKLEVDLLTSKLPKDSAVFKEGIFYQVTKEGSGRLVNLTDTLVVHYKGSLFSDGTIFDQTKEKPATFPLVRLIKGWQIGLVHCRVGGKIRLFIPSGSAYGIRTSSPKIPPNSILVFDVEVLDAKEKK